MRWRRNWNDHGDGNEAAFRAWRDAMTTIPIGIFVIGFAIGGFLPARFLPGLERSRVGAVALAVTCALVGMVLALVGLHVYEIVRALDGAGSEGVEGPSLRPDIVAQGIETMLRDAGPLLGLAGAVYLLAPARDEDDVPDERASTAG